MKKTNTRSSQRKLVLAAAVAALGALLGAAAQAGTFARPMAAMPGMAPLAPAARGASGVLNPAARTFKVGRGTPLASILAMPDNTVLEGPNGARMTVGQFKQHIQAARTRRVGPARASRSGKRIQVRFARSGPSLAQKIDGFRNSENAAAQSGSSSASFNHGGQGQTGGQGKPGPLSRYAVKPSMQTTCFGQTSGVGSVNGRRQGIVFTPGANYVIQGCGFGDQTGKVYVVERAGQIPLQVQSWNSSAIRASIDAGLSGVRDMSHATLVVQPARGAQLTQTGDRFYAARASVPYVMPAQYIQLNTTVGWPPRFQITNAKTTFVLRSYCTGDSKCAADPYELLVYRDTGKFCASWPSSAKDVWMLAEVDARLANSGFQIDDGNIVVYSFTDTTPNASGDTSSGADYWDWQENNMGSFSYSEQNGNLYVQPSAHSYYKGSFTFGVPTSQISDCDSSYSVTLAVSGPRGVPVPHI